MEFNLGSFRMRKPGYEDADGFIEICSEIETMKYYGIPGANIDTVQKAKDQIDWCNNLFENFGGRWIIVEKEVNKYIGDIGFHNYQGDHNKVEIGYRIKQKYWGNGIMTQCIKTLIKYGFDNMNYNRIEALVDNRNNGSKKVLLKNNFKCEGTLRDYEFEHGHYIDMDIFSILRREHNS